MVSTLTQWPPKGECGYLQIVPALLFGPFLLVALYGLLTIIFWRRILPVHNRWAVKSEAHPRKSSCLFAPAFFLYISLPTLTIGLLWTDSADSALRTPENRLRLSISLYHHLCPAQQNQRLKNLPSPNNIPNSQKKCVYLHLQVSRKHACKLLMKCILPNRQDEWFRFCSIPLA